MRPLSTLARAPSSSATVSSSSDGILKSAAIFLIPCLSFQEFGLGGRLFLPELVLLAALPLLLVLKSRPLLTPVVKTFLVLIFAWFASQVLTDFIRDTPFEDWTRGWAKIAIFGVNLVALRLLLANSRSRFVSFGLGLAVGYLLGYLSSPNEFAAENPWKWGYGTALTYFVVIATMHPLVRKTPLAAETLLTILAIPSLLLNFRSLGAICLLTALFLTARRRFQRTNGNIRSTLISLGLLVFAGVTIVGAYELAVTKSWLGETAWEKYQIQTSGEFGLFLGGRNEILGSWPAILDSPLIGHGSWAKNIEYVLLMKESLASLGYGGVGYYADDQIPTHSYLFGAWVEAGLAGAIFWSWILYRTLRLLLIVFRSEEQAAPWIVFLSLDLIWSIFFSPFGALSRLTAAYIIVLSFSILESHQSRPMQLQRGF